MGDPLVIEALGATWRLSRLRLGELRKLEAAAMRTPSPIDEMKAIEGVPDDLRKDWLNQARVESRGWGRIGTPGFDAYLRSSDGLIYATELALKIEHAGLTIDKAREIAESLDFDDLQRVLAAVMGPKTPPQGAAAPTGNPTTSG